MAPYLCLVSFPAGRTKYSQARKQNSFEWICLTSKVYFGGYVLGNTSEILMFIDNRKYLPQSAHRSIHFFIKAKSACHERTIGIFIPLVSLLHPVEGKVDFLRMSDVMHDPTLTSAAMRLLANSCFLCFKPKINVLLDATKP